MRLANGFYNREPQASAAQFSSPRLVGSIEALEDLREGFRRNADATVGNFQDGFAVPFAYGDMNLPTLWCVVDSVVNQIDHDLFQSRSASFYIDTLRGVAAQSNLLIFGK